MSTDTDYMTLAAGFGVIPADNRNAGYAKLGYDPGTGGLGEALAGPGKASAKSSDQMDAFLAGVAAGADPRELAKELRSDTAAPRRRRGQ